jgi:hypothetical protein
MLYEFKDVEALTTYVYDNLTAGEDPVSEIDVDKNRIYLEVGSGTELLTIKINQETGLIQMKLEKPNNQNNTWYWITQRKEIFNELQSFVIKNQLGGRKSRKNRKNRKSRKNRKNN